MYLHTHTNMFIYVCRFLFGNKWDKFPDVLMQQVALALMGTYKGFFVFGFFWPCQVDEKS